MRIIAIATALLLCAGTFFQVQASCLTSRYVTQNKKVQVFEEGSRVSHYEMFDDQTGQWFEAEVVGKNSHGEPVYGFTEDGKAAKEDHINQDSQGGGPGGGGGGGGPH